MAPTEPSPTPDTTAAASALSLRVAHLRLTLEPQATIELTDFAGTVVRGGFGVAFKHTACPLRRQPCDTCLLAASCVYLRIFETPVAAGTPLLPAGGRAPHPFVIEPPERGHRFAPGEPIEIGLTLVGQAEAQLPYFIYAFRRLGEMGLGRGRGRFRLTHVTLANPGEAALPLLTEETTHLPPGPYARPLPHVPPVPPSAGDGDAPPLILHLHTALRLKERGRYGARPTFAILVKQLLRRITLLAACHGDGVPTFDHRAWIRAAEGVAIESEALQWCDLERYSTRQRTKMHLGGWAGSVAFTGPWPPFRPLLTAAELLHIGQGSTFGLGRISVSGGHPK